MSNKNTKSELCSNLLTNSDNKDIDNDHVLIENPKTKFKQLVRKYILFTNLQSIKNVHTEHYARTNIFSPTYESLPVLPRYEIIRQTPNGIAFYIINKPGKTNK